MATNSRTYRIHHKCFSSNHKFEIDDGSDQILYTVRASPLSLSRTLSIYEGSTDKELIKIHEENYHLHVRYDISSIVENKHLATVKRIHDQHHLEKTLEIESIYGVYKVERIIGQYGHEFQLTTGEKIVVDVIPNEKFAQDRTIYHVQINNDEGGDLFLLSLVIVLWCAQRWHHI